MSTSGFDPFTSPYVFYIAILFGIEVFRYFFVKDMEYWYFSEDKLLRQIELAFTLVVAVISIFLPIAKIENEIQAIIPLKITTSVSILNDESSALFWYRSLGFIVITVIIVSILIFYPENTHSKYAFHSRLILVSWEIFMVFGVTFLYFRSPIIQDFEIFNLINIMGHLTIRPGPLYFVYLSHLVFFIYYMINSNELFTTEPEGVDIQYPSHKQ